MAIVFGLQKPTFLAKSHLSTPKCTEGEAGSTSLGIIPKKTVFTLVLPLISPCRGEAHARRTGGGRGEGRAGEQESRRRCRCSRRGKSWTNIELKTKVASGVDQEPRSKQNSSRCQEFHALWSWNSLFASGVENSICTDAETDATHKVFRAPTFTFQT